MNSKFIKKILLCLLLTPMASFGAWFGDSKPPDDLALKAATELAQNRVVSGTEARAFKRDNGWVDPDSANRYLVRYTYEMALKADMPQAVLGLAKEFEVTLSEFDKNPNDASPYGQASINIVLLSTNWTNDQNNLMDRVNRLVSTCDQCIAYWNNEDGDEKTTDRHRIAFRASWAHLESMGFKDDMKKGDGAPWNLTVTFMKTENGWEKI